MQRALDLAQKGLGAVSPNPMVGCVIVHNGHIIGDGWHQQFGGPHAEVNAVNSVVNQNLLKESTVYVTLEPCSHFGKTPPCADLLIEKQVKKVIVANKDPNPKVAGTGIEKLRENGIEVEVGLCEQEGLELNKRFFTFFNEKRPYIILKWAQTQDGFVARKNYDSKWISNAKSRKLVHQWRSEESAILVGYNTAFYDNPRLNVRDWQGNDPIRIVIDKELKLSKSLNLFDQSQPTLCYNFTNTSSNNNLDYVQLDSKNPTESMLTDLYKRGIQSVIIEGGAVTLKKFVDYGLWDEARVFVAEQRFGEGIGAPKMNTNIFAEEMIDNDHLVIYKNK